MNKYEIGATASIESEVAENMAFRSRMYASTIRMLPGVISVSGSGGVADEDNAPALNGGTISETAAFVEGVDTSMTRRGGELRFAIPTSAVNDTQIEAAGFGAEYGRATGGIINTTIKTGTNDFHGEGLYVGQNPKWKAEYQEIDIPRPDDQIDSWEANVGGPIWRDRAWFFLAGASLSSNELDRVPTGDVVDISRVYEPFLGKLNFQPGERHQIAFTAIELDVERDLRSGAEPGRHLLAGQHAQRSESLHRDLERGGGVEDVPRDQGLGAPRGRRARRPARPPGLRQPRQPDRQQLPLSRPRRQLPLQRLGDAARHRVQQPPARPGERLGDPLPG